MAPFVFRVGGTAGPRRLFAASGEGFRRLGKARVKPGAAQITRWAITTLPPGDCILQHLACRRGAPFFISP